MRTTLKPWGAMMSRSQLRDVMRDLERVEGERNKARAERDRLRAALRVHQGCTCDGCNMVRRQPIALDDEGES